VPLSQAECRIIDCPALRGMNPPPPSQPLSKAGVSNIFSAGSADEPRLVVLSLRNRNIS
jgi:hypothetical protein